MNIGNRVERLEALSTKGEHASFDEFRRKVRNACVDRTRQVYFIRQKLKEIHPEVDVDPVLRDAAWDFGVYQGSEIAVKTGRDDLALTSKG